MRTRTLISTAFCVLTAHAACVHAEGLVMPESFSAEDLVFQLRKSDPDTRTRSIVAKPSAHSLGERKAGTASILVTFRTDSAEISSKAAKSLSIVARALRDDQLSKFRFQVQGHADPRGTRDHNLLLSQARAESVTSHLSEKHGISADRLTPIGRGSSEVLNTDIPEAPENRRVTFVRID